MQLSYDTVCQFANKFVAFQSDDPELTHNLNPKVWCFAKMSEHPWNDNMQHNLKGYCLDMFHKEPALCAIRILHPKRLATQKVVMRLCTPGEISQLKGYNGTDFCSAAVAKKLYFL